MTVKALFLVDWYRSFPIRAYECDNLFAMHAEAVTDSIIIYNRYFIFLDRAISQSNIEEHAPLTVPLQ